MDMESPLLIKKERIQSLSSVLTVDDDLTLK